MKKHQSAKARHQLQKRKARVNRVLNKYRGHMHWGDGSNEEFERLIGELSTLNVKYLHVLFTMLDENKGYGDYNKPLRERVEGLILEKTVLK